MKILKAKDVAKLRSKWLKKQGNRDALLGLSTNFPTLDHDHITGYCRGVLDRDVNQFLGKVESAYKRFLRHKTSISLPNILRSTADYLLDNKSTQEIIHPKDVSLKVKRFSRFNLAKQRLTLTTLGLQSTLNKKENVGIYKKYLNTHTYKF